MEVYSAKVCYIPPDDSDFKVLTTSLGEKFYIIWKKNGPWWGGMSCNTKEVGYIPAKCLQFIERLNPEKTREVKLLIAENLEKQNSLKFHGAMIQQYDEAVSPSIPEADYDDEDIDNGNIETEDTSEVHRRNGDHFVRPSSNYYSPSKQELHKELLSNMKRGNPILKKTELQKELERRGQARQKREFEEYRLSQRTSLEMKLAERHAMMTKREEEEMRAVSIESSKSELERVQDRIRRKTLERTINEES